MSMEFRATTGVTETMPARSRFFRAAGRKFGILLVALIALLASAPLVVDRPAGHIVFALVADTVLVVSLHAARPAGSTLAVGLLLAVADFVIGRLAILEGVRWLLLLQIVLWLSILVFAAGTILRVILESERVDVETLKAALCVHLLLGLLWVFVYALIETAAPGSFVAERGPQIALMDERSRWDGFSRLLVFSYSALTTTGFGELAPASGFASFCANLEALTAQVYLAVVIARLVAIRAAQPAFAQDTTT
jgi:hypothetical protein